MDVDGGDDGPGVGAGAGAGGGSGSSGGTSTSTAIDVTAIAGFDEPPAAEVEWPWMDSADRTAVRAALDYRGAGTSGGSIVASYSLATV